MVPKRLGTAHAAVTLGLSSILTNCCSVQHANSFAFIQKVKAVLMLVMCS